MIETGLGFGAHIDEVNGRGQSLVDVAGTNEIKSVLLRIESNCINLKCLASRCIIRNRIDYKRKVPFLKNYIKLHDKCKM